MPEAFIVVRPDGRPYHNCYHKEYVADAKAAELGGFVVAVEYEPPEPERDDDGTGQGDQE